jgi:hypothetical protein
MTDERLRIYITAGLSITVLVMSGMLLVLGEEVPVWLVAFDTAISLYWFPSPLQNREAE